MRRSAEYRVRGGTPTGHAHHRVKAGLALVAVLWAVPALAYIGPGVGITAIGSFLALVAGVVVAIFGFIWYPVKRMLRRQRQSPDGARPE